MKKHTHTHFVTQTTPRNERKAGKTRPTHTHTRNVLAAAADCEWNFLPPLERRANRFPFIHFHPRARRSFVNCRRRFVFFSRSFSMSRGTTRGRFLPRGRGMHFCEWWFSLSLHGWLLHHSYFPAQRRVCFMVVNLCFRSDKLWEN